MNYPIEVGDRVFVYSMGVVRQYTVNAFRIIKCDTELKCEVEATTGTQRHKFFIEDFIRGIVEAQDKKISDIRW